MNQQNQTGTSTQGGNQSGFNNQSGFSTNLFGNNLASFENPFPSLYTPNGNENAFLGQIMGLPSASRYSPEMSQGLQIMQRLLFGNGGTTPISSDPQSILPMLQRLVTESNQGPGGLESQALSTMQSRTDPRALTDAAMRYFKDIVEPGARAGLQAGGLGGAKGGAYAETLGREGSRMALPIAQMIQQALGEYGGAQMGMGNLLESRRATLPMLLEQARMGQNTEQANLASQLFGMGMRDQRPGLMPILQAALGAAGAPRLLSIQDLMRQQGLATIPRGSTSGSTGTTSGTTGSTGTNTVSSGSPMSLGSFLPMLTTLGAAGLLNPGAVSSIGGGLKSLLGMGGGTPDLSLPNTGLQSVLDAGGNVNSGPLGGGAASGLPQYNLSGSPAANGISGLYTPDMLGAGSTSFGDVWSPLDVTDWGWY